MKDTGDLQFNNALTWRLVGPYRGGRVMAVAGHPLDRMVFYFGSSSGGVWRTDDGGNLWHPISDGYFQRGSIGALAIADADPNVIYAGTGECGMRSNVTHGDGVYRSDDGGRAWRHLGLAATQNIARIRVHPNDPDLVYVAAFGHRFGPNPERGVYRSRDGGVTWERVLHCGEHVGAIDLSLDLTNPRILYAALWQARLFPWGRVNHGPGSTIVRSTDGGTTWTDLRTAPGFPAGPLGRCGVAVSPVRPGRVWAQIDAPAGGMYRSDDWGETWTWLSADRNFLVRSWYFMHLTPDPVDGDTIYVVNRKLWKSVDGGRSYAQLNVPYVDEHDLWVDPRDPQRMILGNDGGAAVSFNGGTSWSSIVNQPTAEIYRVAADTRVPYRIYGSQQDNSTISLPSRSARGPIAHFDWYDVGGGESGAIVPRPDTPDIVYAGDLPGLGITRYDHASGQLREIAPWYDDDGQRGDDLAYRFNWTTPIALSPHDPNVLYVAGNVLFRSIDEGHSWEIVSPDLTRNDRATLAASGSNTGENYVANDYCTISAFAESPCAPGVLWAGSDDGLVHASRDNGASWNNVTPPELPAWATTHVEPSPHTAGGCYLSATLHQLDDFAPRMFKTDDYGATWQAITHGIPSDQFVRVVRADPERAGLLYAGTEAGVWVSLDDGAHWQPLHEDLPAVAIYDLAVKDSDLIAATHGRSMWILDDVTPLRQYHTIDSTAAPAHLFLPPPVLRLTRQVYGLDSLVALYSPYAAPNPPVGVVVSYWLNQPPTDDILLELIDRDGTVVSRATSAVAAHAAAPIGPFDYELRGGTATLTGNVVNAEEPGIRWGPITLGAAQHVVPTTRRGLNRCTLPIVYPGARRVPGALGGGITQPLALPGSYTVRLTIGERTWTAPVEIVRDPQTNASQADLEAQFGLMVKIRDKVSVIHDAVNQIRDLRRQIVERTATTEARNVATPIPAAATTLLASLATIEAMLIQPQLHERSGELAGTELAPGLNNKLEKLGYAVARSDHAPTRQSLELFADLSDRTDRQLARLRDVLANDLVAFNQLFADGGIAAIVL